MAADHEVLQGRTAGSARVDLHLHTDRSDGRFPSHDVLARAAAAGVAAVALTDHDVTSDLPAGLRCVDGHPIRLIGAAEVSGRCEARELHLLVYFPGAVPEAFARFCTTQVQVRAERYDRARVALAALGLRGLPEADERAHRGTRSLTRFHLARSLVDCGHAASVREAFHRWLGDHVGLVPPIELTFEEAIRIARAHGASCSWAHPDASTVERLLPRFVTAGLDAIEVYRPCVTTADRRVLHRAARRFGLLETGGTDWHGWPGEQEYGLFRVHAREVAPFLERLGI